MAGGAHVCSLKFKGEVIHKYLAKRYPGQSITHLIGIEANESRRAARFTKPINDTSEYEYPLIDWNMYRVACVKYLEDYGLNVEKSSCIFCPFMSEPEIISALADPKKAKIIHFIEHRFEEESERKHQAWVDSGRPLNKGGRCNKGHWRKNSWLEGQRLFVKKKQGRQLSAREWEQLGSLASGEQFSLPGMDLT